MRNLFRLARAGFVHGARRRLRLHRPERSAAAGAGALPPGAPAGAERAHAGRARPPHVGGGEPARPLLHQARPVPLHAPRHRRHRNGGRAFRPERRPAALSHGGGAGDRRGLDRPPRRHRLRQLFRFGRRRLDRAGPQGGDPRPRGSASRRRQGAAARHPAPLRARPAHLLCRGALHRAQRPGDAPAEAARGRRNPAAQRHAGDGSAAGGRRLFGNDREHLGRNGFPRARRRLGAHRPRRAGHRVGRGHAPHGSRGDPRRRP